MDNQKTLIKEILSDRKLTHEYIFSHRHTNVTPPFHDEIRNLFYSVSPYVIVQAFREGAKSTNAEEVTIISSLLGEIDYGIIVGSSYERAVERLGAIKYEIEHNEKIIAIFGEQVGETWTEGKIVLKNGVCLRAFGVGQSIRGIKHHDKRPDWCLVDDFEDEESVATPEARDKCLKWFMKVLIPAMDRMKKRVRVIGTPLDAESVVVKLSADSGWISKRYPIEYLDTDKQRTPTWPDRNSLATIDEIRSSYERLGMLREYMQEYMCQAEEESQKPFKPEMIRVEPQVRTWQATYAFYDPARTTGPKSAHTGVAVWSWINNRLIVWDAYGKFFKPDELIEDVFRVNKEYSPIFIGIEKTGLNEWIEQPLRLEQVKRGLTLPTTPENAPRDKLGFIKSLQHLFNAGEVLFHKDLPDLKNQLMSFPTGRIDVPNALAYALRMRPGRVVYEDFSYANISDDLRINESQDSYLLINGNNSSVSGMVCQYVNNTLNIFWDMMLEGDSSERVKEVIDSASLKFGRNLSIIIPPIHFDKYNNIGLRQTLLQHSHDFKRGGEEKKGRNAVREILKLSSHGFPSLKVSTKARWTLNAFSGGYFQKRDTTNLLEPEPAENVYKQVMIALESFMANVKSLRRQEDNHNINYAYTKDGRKYISALANRYRN